MKTIKSFALRVVVLLASALPAFAAPETFQSPGVVKNLPAFHARLAERMEYPLPGSTMITVILIPGANRPAPR